jgi:hypothetical protein
MSMTHLPTETSSSLPSEVDDFEPADLADLRQAIDDLEHDSLATRLSGAIGRQISAIGSFIPAPMAATVAKATDAAMKGALRVALSSLRDVPRDARRSARLHKAAAALSGAAGGLFGLAALPVELPVSTTIMLRSIAEIARANGEDFTSPETALACLEVFALGNRTDGDMLAEGGYFAARGVLAKSVSQAVRYLAHRSIAEESAPALLRLLSQIGARFGIVVSQKVAAQSLPFIGAAGGAAVNYAFTAHFQAVARGHFTVRRLERRYGTTRVRNAYATLAVEAKIAA